MTAEQLVPSRETCERMMRAGWTKPTLFAWTHHVGGLAGAAWALSIDHAGARAVIHPKPLPNHLRPVWTHSVPAPTAQEIADALPGIIGSEFVLHSSHTKDERADWRWYFDYRTYDYDDLECVRYPSGEPSGSGPTLVEALAALWLALNEKEKP